MAPRWRLTAFSMWLLAMVCSTSSSLSSQTILEAACSLIVSVDQHRPNDCSSSSPTPFTCSHLQQALAAVNTSELSDLADPVCVSLTTGPHSLTFTDTQIEYSVHIIGSPDGETVVHCLPREDYTTDEFPLHFGASTRVIIEGVDFTGCARPLLFNGTDNVTIEDSHFRYYHNFLHIMQTLYLSLSIISPLPLYLSLPFSLSSSPLSATVTSLKQHLKSTTLHQSQS